MCTRLVGRTLTSLPGGFFVALLCLLAVRIYAVLIYAARICAMG